MKPKMPPYIFGVLGMVSMVVFYAGILIATTGDALHLVLFFLDKWYFLGIIFAGFGFQMFLFQKLRLMILKHTLKMAGTSAGANGIAMAACCAHHAADLLPFVGFAGAVTAYQDWFLAAVALINVLGIWYMWSRIQKQKEAHCQTEPAVMHT
jgi:hypothetical protein